MPLDTVRFHLLCPLMVALAILAPQGRAAADDAAKPNFIVILCDNLGYGDIGCFGSTLHRTPHIDAMAREGVRFTDFYVSSGVCTPSRASLMTGCYPRRVNMHQSESGGLVLRPLARRGLHPREVTLAEVLRRAGYATALIGKWHLGDQPRFLPTRQGFDDYYGIPYSDDMTPRTGQPWPPLPLMRGEQVVEAPADRTTLTKRYTEETIRFLEEHRRQPMLVVLSHAMPGSTRAPFASEPFRGRSKNGPWGDSVEEIDHSTGEILKAVKRLGLDDNTFVLWTSDNGAPRRSPPQGTNRPLGGWGYTTREGGMRVPCIIRWPGKIAPGRVCRELATSMDLLPTFANYASAKIDDLPTIDGRDIAPLVEGRSGAKSPHQAFFYYFRDTLHAVRSGPWKLQLRLPPGGSTFRGDSPRERPRLYHVATDLAEATDVADKHPQVVARLQKYAEQARAELGDYRRAGSGQRAAGHVPQPVALRKE